MNIRTYQPGDEIAQVSIYNEMAGALPHFKIATVDEVRRRHRSHDFDPQTCLYAVADGRVVGYITYQLNGRISYPWCRQEHRSLAEPLLQAALEALRRRGLRQAWTAYRQDWTSIRDFFLAQGFTPSGEMINYVLDMVDMPTPAARPALHITPLQREDLPTVLQLGQKVLRCTDVPSLERALFNNPYLSPADLFILRPRSDGQPLGVCCIVSNEQYADPKQVDSEMPCFRLGAFGTEGLTHKRIRGLFSFLVADNRDQMALGLDLLNFACRHVESKEISTLAAQVCSTATHLNRFYNHFFRRQGSFPLFARDL